MISFNTVMTEKKKRTRAAVALVVIIIGAVVVTVLVKDETILQTIMENLFGEDTTIKLGDYVDVHYIGRYASNNTIFDSSYADPVKKTGGTPLKLFVNIDRQSSPSTEFGNYSSTIGTDLVVGFNEGLVGMKKGQTGTIGPIPPEKAYGVFPKVGDIINLSAFYGEVYNITYEIFVVQNNAPMPEDYVSMLGNGTTTLYTLRENWHYVGETVDPIINLYPSWTNSTVVTQMNETLMWMYTTPPANLSINFTWVDMNSDTGVQTVYPENTSTISSINNTTIVITHNPAIGSEITEYSMFSTPTYTVEQVTADKINASNTTSPGSKTYKEFDRTKVIQRNQTRNITLPPFPGEFLDQYIFSYLRDIDPNFHLSFNPLADQEVTFEVKILDVHKVKAS